MRQRIELVPPKHGLHEGEEFAHQPPLTTRLTLNMRTQQASTGRLRSSKRAGYRRQQASPVLKNYLSFSEDFGHFRDTVEGDSPWPPNEGWLIQVTGAKSVSAATDGTLGPDQVIQAQLVKQLLASGSNRAEVAQQFDVNPDSSLIGTKPGAVFVRKTGDLMFSAYMHAADASASQITIRQGTGGSSPRTSLVITWTAGVPSIVPTTVGAGNHPSGFTDEGNGWYRFWVGLTWQVSAEVTDPTLRVILLPNQADTGAKGTYFWGAQLEIVVSAATEPTRYEPVLGKNAPSGKQKGAALLSVNHIQSKQKYRRKPAQLVPTRSFATPSKQSAHAIAWDLQKNRYVLEPQAVVKYSAQGDLVFSIPIPIDDPAHVCQALHVDETGQIYVGITSGGDVLKAKLLCFRQGPEVVGGEVRENSFHLLWTVVTKQYVIGIQSRAGVLYTVQDDPVRRRSELVTYDAIDFPAPDVAARRFIPYPSAGFCIKSDASVVTCHPTNITRGLDPSSNGSDTLGPWPTAVSWTPQNDLSDWAKRVWCFLDSEFINGPGRRTIDDFKQDDEVGLEWNDISGKARSVFRVTGNTVDIINGGGPRTVAPPKVTFKGMNGVPSLHFDGVKSALISDPNPGTDETNLDLHRTLIPAYDGAKATAFVVFRPAYKATQGALLKQQAFTTLAPEAPLALCANRAASDILSNPSRGRVGWYQDTTGTADPATGTGNQPTEHLLEAGGLVNFCIATIKISPNAGESFVRFNGTDTEAGGYSSYGLNGVTPTILGTDDLLPSFGFFEGDLFAILVYNELLSDTDIQLHEGYFANRYGGQGRLDAAHPYKLTPGTGIQVPSTAPISAGKADVNQLNHRSNILAKFAPGSELKWTATNYSGVGFDVLVDPAGSLFSFGEYQASETSDPYLPSNRGRRGWLRKVLDNGDSVNPDDLVADWCQNKCRSGNISVSNDFSDAFWTATDVTVATNSTTDPFGGSLADTLTDGATAGAGTIRHDFVTADLFDLSDFTFSVYLKANTATTSRIKISQVGGTGSTQIDFTYATRAILPTVAGAGRKFRWDYEDAGNGWFRLQVSLDFKSTDSGTLRIEIVPDTTGAQLSCFAYGAMLERNSYASTFAYDANQQKHNEPPNALSTPYPRLALDSFGNIFVPGPFPIGTLFPNQKTLFTARVYDKNLYLVGDADVGRLATDDFRPGRAIAINPEPPNFRDNNPGLQRNLLGFTQRFDDPFWTKFLSSVTPNTRIAPDGTATADTLKDTSATGIGIVARDVSSGPRNFEYYTFSVFLSPQDATSSIVALAHSAGPQLTQILITWNTSSKRAPTIVESSVHDVFGIHASEMEPAPNGFWRFSVTVRHKDSQGNISCRITPDATTANQGSVTAWGAQLEHGIRMTPYQRVDGRWSFEPPPVLEVADPIGITDQMTVVTPNKDVENAATAPLSAVHEFDLVESEPNGLEARASKLALVARGSLYVLDSAGPIDAVGVVEEESRLTTPETQIPRGGSSCLDQDARYVSVTALFQRIIATDGKRSIIYQPHIDGQVRPYVAKNGTVPEGVELWSNWRGRAVAARTPDNPHAWFMSAIEDLFDWDYFTPPLRSDKAVFSATSRAGLAPDIINTIIPYDDQQLIIGCDHAIWYLPADPLSERAEWQLVSDITGVSFGNHSWCKDDQGMLYFFGSRGGFYRIAPGGVPPQNLTTETIQRHLTNIDLDRFYVELFWNWREEGVNIYVIPYGSPLTVVEHFFWGRRFNEWRIDTFSDLNIQPTSATVMDGDLARDRRLLFVDPNMNILEWNEDEKNDDGLLIDGKELLGPFDIGEDREARWSELMVVLSEDSDAARFEMYTSDSADNIGAIKATGALGPGRNARSLARVRGSKFWLLLGNNVVGQSFAFEEGGIYAMSAGRARVR